MLRNQVTAIAMTFAMDVSIAGCGRSDSGTQNTPSVQKHDETNVLNFYNWADYIAPDTISSFEKLTGIKLDFVIPDEGSLLWFDMLAIPRDAPHASNAHAFINYLMDPQVIANDSKFIGNANANSAVTPLLDASIVSDPIVYAPPEVQQRLFVQTEDPPNRRGPLPASGRSSRRGNNKSLDRTIVVTPSELQ